VLRTRFVIMPLQTEIPTMRRVLVTFMAASLLLVAALPATARQGPPPGVQPGGDPIVDLVVASTQAAEPEFTLLLDAVLYIAETNPDSALVAGLFDNDQYTVFAPTDAAFLGLVEAVAPSLDEDVLAEEGPFAAIDALLGDGTVEAVVSYHVTEGRRATNSVLPKRGERTISTLLPGATFSVDSSANITAVGSTATIVIPNISASNGVVHAIDQVLLPIDLGL
jgi:uncharacterized surface protein with fasciclin (FAS1) repeats